MTLRKEYKALLDKIWSDTSHMSMHKPMLEHPCYKEIASRGHEFFPFVLEDFGDDERCGWFHFHMISHVLNDQPEIPDEHKGTFDYIRKAYGEHLKKLGYSF